MRPSNIPLTLTVASEGIGQRLDLFLAQHLGLSRSYLQMLVEKKHVFLNNSPAKKSAKLQLGDSLHVDFIIVPEVSLIPEAIPLDILYEDEVLLAINKPAGMVVHPGAGNWTGTFAHALLAHCLNQGVLLSDHTQPLRPGIVHRLDKETSGVLIAAKTTQAHQRLVEMFAARQIHKEYLAICVGNPGDCAIDAPIARHSLQRKMMDISPSGKKAITLCKTLAHTEKMSLVRLILETGRTHQIRVHLRHRKTPILGDSTYGNPSINARYAVKRQLLHARRVRFTHPLTGMPLKIEAPLPVDMQEWTQKLFGPDFLQLQ
jgi:23S rRNA pseudouridine1911/1915/1917 synthase